jgi:hypothetical protein
MKKGNLVLWFLLVLLTLITYYSSENYFTGKILVAVLMGIVIIKFLGIGFQFIELKDAHPVWKVLFTGFILLFSLLVLIIS